MSLLIRLLTAAPKLARAFRDFSYGLCALALTFVGQAYLERFQNWLWGTPQEQSQIVEQLPPLSAKEEVFFEEFQQHMDTLYQIQLLKRYILTLPALPAEGS